MHLMHFQSEKSKLNAVFKFLRRSVVPVDVFVQSLNLLLLPMSALPVINWGTGLALQEPDGRPSEEEESSSSELEREWRAELKR